MKWPLVSIILFAHAPYARFLPYSLESILEQSYRHLEVLVLTDGSDAIGAIVERFMDDGRVHLCPQTRPYFLETANELMTTRKGEYLGTWNSDDIYNVDHIKVLVQALEADPGIGAAFNNMEYFSDAQAGITLKNGDSSLGLVVARDWAKRLAASRLSVQDIFTENFMTGPASLIRKSAFEQVGGYDKDIFLNCDLHWFYRIAAYFPVRFVDYVGVRKRIHPLNNTAVNPHYEYGLKELEHIRTHYPDVYSRIGKSVFHKKLGRKYFRLGLYYEKNGEIHKARDMYRRAMLLRKWSFRYSWEYVRSTMVTKLGWWYAPRL